MAARSPDSLLSPDTVAAYLVSRGIATAGTVTKVRRLGGGISSGVFAVQAGDRRLVVKQSLPQLRVAEQWLAPQERIVAEAHALRWAASVTPGAVPAVLDLDEASFVIVIAHAPLDWAAWKTPLLAGTADPVAAARLGTLLAAWHVASRDLLDPAPGIDTAGAFDKLRVDPYYRTVMRRHPNLAPEVAGYVDRMLAAPRCLVHGDYSPKNVLLGPGGLWVVDFETAHRGDPAFDLAFMLNHLMLKALHRPAQADDYARCTGAFLDAYRAGTPAGFAGPVSYVLGHTACLMLARVDGKSPAEYLTPEGRERARLTAIDLLTSPPSSLNAAWDRLHTHMTRQDGS